MPNLYHELLERAQRIASIYGAHPQAESGTLHILPVLEQARNPAIFIGHQLDESHSKAF
jgi:hypothetical protein